ncbi:telomere repeat-binding factor 1-like [Apium graveolens]|uniref:telomere repeat-binding factor 1-like n=1 Tax=Apium graveolens TaxID=4045 RepID=UPI003D78F2D5
MGRSYNKWSSEEEAAIRNCIAKHGVGKWQKILSDPEFSTVLVLRKSKDLQDKWRHIIIKGKAQTAQPKAPSTVHESLEDGDSDKLLLRFSDCIQDGPTNNESAALTIAQTEARALVHKSMEDGVTDKPTVKVYMRRHKMHQQSPQNIKVYTRRHKRGNKATAK